MMSDYIVFDNESCWFCLSDFGMKILYDKNIISSYSGANEWCHHFFCELLDLFSGCSIYNYALGCYEHEKMIAQLCQEGHATEVANWVERHKNDDWFVRAVESMTAVIDNLPGDD